MSVTPHNSLRLVGGFAPFDPADRPVRSPAKSVLREVPRVRLIDPASPAQQSGSSAPGALSDFEIAQLAVATENLQAARMSALDARWIVAVQVERALQGGSSAILPPDARSRIMALAERVGLRTFDASLVIAVIQDAARSGEDPLGPLAVDRLRLVRPGDASPLYTRTLSRARFAAVGMILIALAATSSFLAARWLLS